MPQNFSELAHAAKTAQVDAAGLESALRRHLRGEVRFDAGSRALYAPDPASHDRCTLGGMIGNNSCGVHSIMAGKTDDNVEELEILTYDGLRMKVGETSDQELDAIIRKGGRRGGIYAGLKSLRDKY